MIHIAGTSISMDGLAILHKEKVMLWAEIKEDGTLELRPGDSLESCALRSWERMHKSGTAKIVINTDRMYSINELANLLKKDLVSMQKWKAEQAAKCIQADGIVDG